LNIGNTFRYGIVSIRTKYEDIKIMLKLIINDGIFLTYTEDGVKFHSKTGDACLLEGTYTVTKMTQLRVFLEKPSGETINFVVKDFAQLVNYLNAQKN
jgi:predicted RNA-binding protein